MKRRTLLLGGATLPIAGCFGPADLSFSDAEAAWPPLGRMVEAGGHSIHVWEQGQGTPVVLLHGASGNLRDWSWQPAKMVAGKRRAIAMDRPGLGYSTRSGPNGGDPAAQARALIAASRAMGLDRPIVVGHSLGAAVAMAWALADPQGVRAVVAVSGTVMPWFDTPALAELIGLDEVLIGGYFDYVQASAARGGIDRFVERIFKPQQVPEGYIDYVGGPLSLRPDTLAANKQDVGTLNTALRRQSRDYGRVTLPVEVISGTEDFIVDPDRQPIPFADRLPNATLTLLDGVGHMAHHVRPEVLIQALDRLDPASA